MTHTGAGWFLPDYENYTNAQFRIAKNQHGFIKDNRKNADYNTTTNSWIEQRTYLTDASKLLAGEHPDLMASIDEALVKLKDVQLPSTSGMATVANPAGQKFSCKGVELAFDERAAISHLMTSTSTTPTTAKDAEGAASPLSSTSSTSSTSWASVANPVGLYQYVRRHIDDSSTSLVNSRTLTGCTDPLRELEGGPHQCPLGSGASYPLPLCADLRTF